MADMETRGWRDIETAPRDGKTVLLSRAHLGDDVLYGHWNGVSWWCAWPEFHSETLAISREIYRVDAGAHEYKTISIDNPTHWMPLPTPPEDTGHAILSNTKEGG